MMAAVGATKLENRAPCLTHPFSGTSSAGAKGTASGGPFFGRKVWTVGKKLWPAGPGAAALWEKFFPRFGKTAKEDFSC